MQDEVNGEENRDRMGAGVFMLIFLGKGSYKVFCRCRFLKLEIPIKMVNNRAILKNRFINTGPSIKAIPLQYLMSENYGVALNQRNMQSLQLVTGATHFAKTWLDPSKWEKRFEEFQDYIDKLAADLEEKQRKHKNAKKTFSKGWSFLSRAKK